MTQVDITSSVAHLLHEGQVALDVGDTLKARKYFRQVTEREPNNVAAWLGMADSVRPYRDKQRFLQRVLAIDPNHPVAQEKATYVQQQLDAGKVLAPKTTVDAPDDEQYDTLGGAAVNAVGVSTAQAAPVQASTIGTAPTVTPKDDQESTTDVEIGHCYIHPDRETGLRCVQCSRYICTECVRPAFVGQLCPECARERRPVNYQVTTQNLVVTAIVTIVASVLVTLLANMFLGFAGFFSFIIAFILGPVVGEGVLRLLGRATHNKRGREMQLTAGISYVVGTSPWTLLPFIVGFIPSLSVLLLSGMVVATIITRLR